MPRWPRRKSPADPAVSARPGDGTPRFLAHAVEARPRVHRPDPVTALKNAFGARLIVVTAPAGYGKTSLIAEWRAASDRPRAFAHVSLQAADNDPAVLWPKLTAALGAALPPPAGPRLMAIARGRWSPDVEAGLLPRVLTALAAQAMPVVLVLDDHHRLDHPVCHGQIEALIDRLPPGGQVVLAGRIEPVLPLSRYRARGELLELRIRDLRLTGAQAGPFIRQVAGVQLREPDVQRLVERTEGWPAAIYLAAQSLRESPDPAGFVADFSGTSRFVADYVEEEVLGPLPADLRRFMVRSAVLTTFTAPLFDAVAAPDRTGSGSGPFERLVRANPLVIPLDEHRLRYRYHHLLLDVLRDELAADQPDAVPELHRLAGDWCAGHGDTDDAIDHALAGGDADRALHVLTRQWMIYAGAGRFAAAADRLAEIGAQRVARSAAAAICAAWIYAACGDRATARHWLRVAEELPGEGPLPDGSPSVRFSAAMIRAVFGFDGVPAMLAAAEAAVALVTDPLSPWHVLARAALGYARYLSGDAEGAALLEEEVQTRAHVLPPTFQVLTLSVLSLSVNDAGRGAQAGRFAATAYELLERYRLTESPAGAMAAMARGAAYGREGRHTDARRVLEYAVDLRVGTVGLSAWPTVQLLLTLTRTLLDAGDREAARARLDDARSVMAAEADAGEHLRGVLQRLERRLSGPGPGGGPVEALTEREETVLRLLRADLSLREIGERLFVSVNTVKSHTQAVYRKLGVSSRGEAIRRARDLGIL